MSSLPLSSLPHFHVSLSSPPTERWHEVASHFRVPLQDLTVEIPTLVRGMLVGPPLPRQVDGYFLTTLAKSLAWILLCAAHWIFQSVTPLQFRTKCKTEK
jgi:hypothetical protein